jgi:hypothetical protein
MIDMWTMLMNLPRVIWETKFNLKEIKKFLKLAFAHVEIWIPSQYFAQPRSCDWKNGVMWTSTMRDEDNGTVQRQANQVMRHPWRWWYWEFKVNSDEYKAACDYGFNELVNNEGYSKRDISKFFPVVRHIVPDDDTRNICSEFSTWFMVHAKVIFKKFKMLSPRLMAWKIYRATGTMPVQVQEKK